MRDLKSLSKFRDSWSYLYLEKCKIEQDKKAIAFIDANGKTSIPCANLSVLMLGPGTSITHSAVKSLSDNGCLIIWVGEEGIRFYANGLGKSRSSAKLIKQAKLVSDEKLRLKIVRRLYTMRFAEKIPEGLTLQQIRGLEGARVRTGYQRASKKYGVEWKGRRYNPNSWEASDPINQAISSANACLNSLCHAAIISNGYSPGLGFIHTGKQLSFVYDIADLYKTQLTIPIAFYSAANLSGKNLGREVRIIFRDSIKSYRLLPRIVQDIEKALSLPEKNLDDLDEFASEPAIPGGIWDPEEVVLGGINYGPEEN